MYRVEDRRSDSVGSRVDEAGRDDTPPVIPHEQYLVGCWPGFRFRDHHDFGRFGFGRCGELVAVVDIVAEGIVGFCKVLAVTTCQ